MAGNPFLDRIADEKPMSHGKKSEKRLTKTLGARPTPASGALRGAKGDATLGQFRMEMKSTTTTTMALQRAWLGKISVEALSKGQVPAITVSFVDTDGKPALPRYAEWVMIPMAVFQELLDKE